jgi:hypothetical protein
VKCEDEAESIKRVPDVKDKVRFFRSGVNKLIITEVIFSEVVSEFKLRGFKFL